MGAGKSRKDEEMAHGVASRLSLIFKGQMDKDVAKALRDIVTDKAIWAYRNEKAIPIPQVLKRISEVYDVSVDWILNGDESQFPKDPTEVYALEQFRQARIQGIAEEAMEYVTYLIDKKEKEMEDKEGKNQD